MTSSIEKRQIVFLRNVSLNQCIGGKANPFFKNKTHFETPRNSLVQNFRKSLFPAKEQIFRFNVQFFLADTNLDEFQLIEIRVGQNRSSLSHLL